MFHIESIFAGRYLPRQRTTPETHCRGNGSCQGDRSPYFDSLNSENDDHVLFQNHSTRNTHIKQIQHTCVNRKRKILRNIENEHEYDEKKMKKRKKLDGHCSEFKKPKNTASTVNCLSKITKKREKQSE